MHGSMRSSNFSKPIQLGRKSCTAPRSVSFAQKSEISTPPSFLAFTTSQKGREGARSPSIILFISMSSSACAIRNSARLLKSSAFLRRVWKSKKAMRVYSRRQPLSWAWGRFSLRATDNRPFFSKSSSISPLTSPLDLIMTAVLFPFFSTARTMNRFSSVVTSLHSHSTISLSLPERFLEETLSCSSPERSSQNFPSTQLLTSSCKAAKSATQRSHSP